MRFSPFAAQKKFEFRVSGLQLRTSPTMGLSAVWVVCRAMIDRYKRVLDCGSRLKPLFTGSGCPMGMRDCFNPLVAEKQKPRRHQAHHPEPSWLSLIG
jgi:hypothetical protein